MSKESEKRSLSQLALALIRGGGSDTAMGVAVEKCDPHATEEYFGVGGGENFGVGGKDNCFDRMIPGWEETTIEYRHILALQA